MDHTYPYLCMIVNPKFDESGMPIGGEIIGDNIDKRNIYAPPYPTHVGNSTTVHNPEYPGKENVLVGPILNGFDLSSWAQIPSGKKRFLFMFRPKNSTPFFELDDKLKRMVLLDTTLELKSKEVYTMNILQKDFGKKKYDVILRQENFHKQAFSDSLVYVNFYNYSSNGFFEAPKALKNINEKMGMLKDGIKDDLNIYLSLYRDTTDLNRSPIYRNYRSVFLGNVKRNLENNNPAVYYNFPVWADTSANGIYTNTWQRLEFLLPGMDISSHPYAFLSSSGNSHGNYFTANFIKNGDVVIHASAHYANGIVLPNLLINIHSGEHNPKTFASVNTLEIINNLLYLTTIQRKYPAPKY
ncbi:hypothetical protein ACP6L2_05405 [Sphingobacterium lactis]|uniref:hypothetical protein n=1 Tax=Sphingobacterium lactis TaxID=797291 RepID=UPI003F7E5C5F